MAYHGAFTFRGKTMNILQSSKQRSDEHLDAILAETEDWVIYAPQAVILGFAASLRHALDLALESTQSGAAVLAISRLADDTVVFPAQMDRLRKVIAGRETPPIKRSDIFADTIDGPMDR
jgi:hypothetical protein